MLYRVLMALHVVSVISWMAGILYLIRLFVYHAAEKEEVVKARFRVMEHKLLHIITLPAMTASLLFGIAMVAMNTALLRMPWFHAKLLSVVLLIVSTVYCISIAKEFKTGGSRHTERFFRFYNEVPTLLMIIIVFLVILKPF